MEIVAMASRLAPRPRWMPLTELLYAQVVKTMQRRRIVEVKHRVILGTKAGVDQVLAAYSWQINTAFVEHLNLSLRQQVAAMRRCSATSCKGEDGLRQPLAEPVPTHGTGSTRVWRPCTPAMAAGLTDHVWSLREVLLYRVPPGPQTQTV
jgi:hypothetical protein